MQEMMQSDVKMTAKAGDLASRLHSRQKRKSAHFTGYEYWYHSIAYCEMNAFVHCTYSIINAGKRQASCKKICSILRISYNLHRNHTAKELEIEKMNESFKSGKKFRNLS